MYDYIYMQKERKRERETYLGGWLLHTRGSSLVFRVFKSLEEFETLGASDLACLSQGSGILRFTSQVFSNTHGLKGSTSGWV